MVKLLALLLVACKAKEVEPRPIDAGRPIDAAIDARPIDAPPAKAALKATKLAVGDSACAVMEDLTVRCWGANDSGQLGTGTRAPSNAAVTPELHAVKDLQIDGATACALLDDGSVACWGRIAWHGKREDTLKPAGVLGVTGVTQLFVLAERACARVAKGGLVCWGDVDAAAHVKHVGANRPPTPAAGMDHVKVLTADAALRDDGTLITWGAKPVTLAGVAEIGLRDAAICGRMDDGSVQCPVPHCVADAPPPPAPPPKKLPPPPKKGGAKKPKPAKPAPPPPSPPAPKIETLQFPPARQLAFELGWCVVTTANKLVCGDGCNKPEAPKAEHVERVVGGCVIGKDVRCNGKRIDIPVTSLIAGSCAITEGGGVVCWGADGMAAPVAL